MPKCNKRNEKNNENLILLNTPKIPCHMTRDFYNLYHTYQTHKSRYRLYGIIISKYNCAQQ